MGGRVTATARLSADTLRVAFAEAPVPMVLADPEGEPAGAVLAANTAAAQLLGRPAEALLGSSLGDLLAAADAAAGPVTPIAPPGDHGAGPVVLVVLRSRATPHRTGAHVADTARRDPLTGLADRDALARRLAALSAEADGPFVAVIYLDLDRFKSVNDSGGHELGDQVLLAVSRRLRAAIRPGDLLARPGGDEFVVVCPHLASPADSRAVAERLRATLAEPVSIGGRPLRLSMSLGIAAGRPGRADPADLLRHADLAMYRAKAAGRDTLRYHSAQMDAAAAAELAAAGRIEQALRAALAQPGDPDAGHLELDLSPVVDLASGRTAFLEARATLRLADGSVVGPREHLPVARRSGLDAALAAWVLRGALGHRRALPQPDRDVALCVRAGPGQVQPRAFRELLGILRTAGEHPDGVLLAVGGPDGPQPAGPALRRLQAAGVGLVVVGAGASVPAAELAALRGQRIRVESDLVRRAALDVRARALLRGIAGLAHELGHRVVAAGVRTAAERRAAEAAGCDEATGPLFG